MAEKEKTDKSTSAAVGHLFGVFWIVFRYNILYVTDSGHDSGGMLYPTALNQLFTGVYVMELCVTGLFFLVRDDHNRATCIGQAVIMIVAMVITVSFQLLLNDAFAPQLRFVPMFADIAEPEKKAQEKKHECGVTKADECFRTLLQKCYDWKVVSFADQGSFTTLFSNIKKPIPSETDELISPTYQHEALSVQKPTVWIPKDCLGISDDEILRVRRYDNSIRVSNEHAALDIKRK
ncbi:MAG: hypothetical protein Q9187_001630, partial [Circinaria calcarea]